MRTFSRLFSRNTGWKILLTDYFFEKFTLYLIIDVIGDRDHDHDVQQVSESHGQHEERKQDSFHALWSLQFKRTDF